MRSHYQGWFSYLRTMRRAGGTEALYRECRAPSNDPAHKAACRVLDPGARIDRLAIAAEMCATPDGRAAWIDYRKRIAPVMLRRAA